MIRPAQITTMKLEGVFTGRTTFAGDNLTVLLLGEYDVSTIPWPRAPGAGFETVLFRNCGEGPGQIRLTHWHDRNPTPVQVLGELLAGRFTVAPAVKQDSAPPTTVPVRNRTDQAKEGGKV